MRQSFTKMHGLGNDFVVIDATRRPFVPSADDLRRIADRRFGVGCDQILVVEPASAPDIDFDYRIYNADGSESGQCGNGARCLARFVRDKKLSERDTIRVRTQSSVLVLQLLADGQVRVDMGAPRFEPADIPMLATQRETRYRHELDGATLEFGALSMGNPHAVILVDDLDTAPVRTLGPRLQTQAIFPQQANVGFMQIVDRDTLRLRVYERGAGETLACGSGACAAAVIARLWDRVGKAVTVQLPGGSLQIEWDGEGQPVFMTGPASTVFTGDLEWFNQ
ncbi:diaminopimelate epimerase [Algiphilus sp. W345]|uniref:Diaminopimelate epimerase n=1 Tax=Banduia mediterranea TaxID=3075609 RepID=A0ABU2WLP5_9GAMM|nr:diaminopimelate epimerase [Algiphilus sp. W345]MDT0498795.1 diaminopimelate epimerase [Algiphilus sp. W345]